MEDLEIIISSKSKKPIYDQISSQIKESILVGKLKCGDSLPAMRQLAKSLRVSVITVQKAYENLQKDGFIDSTVGRGTFVAQQNIEKIRSDNMTVIGEYFKEAIYIAKNSGVDLSDMTDLLKKMFEEEMK